MDDFGTGYSSLAYLRRFPVDILKIARELIGGPVEAETRAWAFAQAIIALGHSLGLPIVAEGIETAGQLRCCAASAASSARASCSAGRSPAEDLEAHLIAGVTPTPEPAPDRRDAGSGPLWAASGTLAR